MIDLRFPLPSTVSAEGREWEVRTGWRWWLEFGYLLRTERVIWHGVLEEPPDGPMGAELMGALVGFYAPAEELPRDAGGGSHERAVDPMVDGSLIVAAFQQAYGIDLTSHEADGIHWHRFMALLAGIPQDTALARVMGVRTWNAARDGEKRETAMGRAKAAWRLPEAGDDDWVRKQQEWFGAAAAAE